MDRTTVGGLVGGLAALLMVATGLLVPASSGAGAATARASHVQPLVPSTWSESSSIPNPEASSINKYNGISCFGPSFCMAVGDESDSPTETDTQFAAIMNGSSWMVSDPPAVAGATSTDLEAVSCLSPTWCMAGGTREHDGFTQTLAELWNGSTWTVMTTPNPGGATGDSRITGVSCSYRNYCVAVGDYDNGGETTFSFAASSDGSEWWQLGVLGAATPGTLRGISCSGGYRCQAVGSIGNDNLAVSFWGGEVTIEPIPSPAFYQTMTSVSCLSATDCMAAGFDGAAGGVLENLVEQFDGSRWTVQPTPDVATGSGDELEAIGCVDPSLCVAGGMTFTDNGFTTYANELLVFDGTSWQIEASPDHAGLDAIEAVTCVADASCYAVGQDATAAEGLVASVVRPGYWEVAADGGVFAFGTPYFGSMGGKRPNSPIVGMAMTPDGGGYWEVAADGGVFAFGDAPFDGSMGDRRLDSPVVGIAPTLDGQGYWEVAADGGVFAFGDAPFDGSMGSAHLVQPVVGMAATPDGLGYYEVAADGGLFAFGDARFHGSMGGRSLVAPVVGMGVNPGGGYYEVAADGGLFTFGGAPFHGSMGGRPLVTPVVGMGVNPGGGYWEVAADGGVFAFGAQFSGSMGGRQLNNPIVAIAQ